MKPGEVVRVRLASGACFGVLEPSSAVRVAGVPVACELANGRLWQTGVGRVSGAQPGAQHEQRGHEHQGEEGGEKRAGHGTKVAPRNRSQKSGGAR